MHKPKGSHPNQQLSAVIEIAASRKNTLSKWSPQKHIKIATLKKKHCQNYSFKKYIIKIPASKKTLLQYLVLI